MLGEKEFAKRLVGYFLNETRDHHRGGRDNLGAARSARKWPDHF